MARKRVCIECACDLSTMTGKYFKRDGTWVDETTLPAAWSARFCAMFLAGLQARCAMCVGTKSLVDKTLWALPNTPYIPNNGQLPSETDLRIVPGTHRCVICTTTQPHGEFFKRDGTWINFRELPPEWSSPFVDRFLHNLRFWCSLCINERNLLDQKLWRARATSSPYRPNPYVLYNAAKKSGSPERKAILRRFARKAFR